MSQKVISREYKIMLNKERFIGSEADLLKRAKEFWDSFKDATEGVVLDTSKSLKEIEKRRTVRFYDTPDRRLRASDYVFRERVDDANGKREVVLKFRHPDRYVAEDRNMDAADVRKGKSKFEEDIKPPFIKLYSFSTKQKIDDDKRLNKLNDPGCLFPDLKKRMLSYRGDDPLMLVGDFTARELVITGAGLQIGKNPKVEAECALVVWYNADCKESRPVVAEFSFKYKGKDEKEEYDGATAKRAYEVFRALEAMPVEWIDSMGPTKTAFVYSRA